MIDKNDEIVIQDEQKDLLFKQTLTRLERCSRTKKVNTADTIALVSKAMGSRTITDFANAMNENVMKISRILSGTTVTLKPELIAKITAYASPDTDYSLDELMKAQGFVDLFQRVNRGMRFVEGCRKTITDELLIGFFLTRKGSLSISTTSRNVKSSTILKRLIARTYGCTGQWQHIIVVQVIAEYLLLLTVRMPLMQLNQNYQNTGSRMRSRLFWLRMMVSRLLMSMLYR